MEIVAHVIKEVRLLRYVIAGGLHGFVFLVCQHILEIEDGGLAALAVEHYVVLFEERVDEVAAVGKTRVGAAVLHLALAQSEVSLNDIVVVQE